VGRRILVTGAASGIGEAVVRRMRAEGARVAGLDLDTARLATIDLDVRVRCDVAEEESVDSAVAMAADMLGGLDGAVCAAGIMRHATVTDLSVADWDRTMAVNARGLFLVGRAVIPHLRRAGGGTIVNVASQLGLVATAGAAAYCASKGAAIQLTRAMAVDHACDRITVNAVCPGPTDTPMLQRDLEAGAEPADARAAMETSMLTRRLVAPDEVAAAVAYLVGPDGRSATGSVLVVDGGFTAV
jgi:NAD(P)-dependent dehydrogenase (short-subunit alcohol dehydrogenase family)